MGLQGVIGDNTGLQLVKRGASGFIEGYKELQEVTGGYKGLQGVTGGYKGLQRVTKGERGLQRVTGN